MMPTKLDKLLFAISILFFMIELFKGNLFWTAIWILTALFIASLDELSDIFIDTFYEE
jgi:hypothetical protein